MQIKKKDSSLKRERMPYKLVEEYAKLVSLYPNRYSKFYITKLIQKDYARVEYFYSDPSDSVLTMKDMKYIAKGTSNKDKEKRYNERLKDKTLEFRINPRVINRMKKRFNKNPKEFDRILGAIEMGYIKRSAMKSKDAANFIIPRMSLSAGEADDMNFCIKLLAKKATSPEGCKTAKRLIAYGKNAYVPGTLRSLVDGVSKSFL